MRALLARLAYLGYLLRPGFWRWLVSRVDHVVLDNIEPWTRLRRPPRCQVHPTVSMREAQNIELGAHTRVQNWCVLWASPNSKIRVGEHSGLGPGTMIYSSNHEYAPGKPYHTQPWVEKDVTIGRDCWIGGGSIILPGVSIGDGCVVAAGSVVTKSIPAGSVAAGVPAKVIRAREPAAALPGAASE